MCIVVYKRNGVKMPSTKILKNCFDNNPDGAGYMYAHKGKVHIFKGFMNFEKFMCALEKSIATVGEKIPYVLHFRISTQAGTRADCTHPFPLSPQMNDLRKLRTKSGIGIAHNGIISLTSAYAKQITHSDTMEFITDYLSLIIKNSRYYESKDTMLLIQRLCESKLAILDGQGHCELVGNGWVLNNDIYYSNKTYEEIYYSRYMLGCDEYDEIDEYATLHYDPKKEEFNFNERNCTYFAYGVEDYCPCCSQYSKCRLII